MTGDPTKRVKVCADIWPDQPDVPANFKFSRMFTFSIVVTRGPADLGFPKASTRTPPYPSSCEPISSVTMLCVKRVVCDNVVCDRVVCDNVVCERVVCERVVFDNVACENVVSVRFVCERVVCDRVVCENVMCVGVVCV